MLPALPAFNFVATKLRLASFDSSGKMICSRTTGYQILTLEKDQVCLWGFELLNLNGGVQGMKKMLRSHQCF